MTESEYYPLCLSCPVTLNTNYPAYDPSFFSDEALMSPALDESSNATKGINVECSEHGL
jgi:hypothetical protein